MQSETLPGLLREDAAALEHLTPATPHDHTSQVLIDALKHSCIALAELMEQLR
jgi:hypothetical protein